MSGFQDTFGRNNQDTELQYDDAASYFFFASILVLIVIPLVIHVINSWRQIPSFDPKKVKCRWREEANREEFMKRKFTRMFYIKAFLAVVLIYLLAVCIVKGSELKNLKTFDPYEILQVDSDATDVQIKKAYKKLAKIYHPDLNQGDADAQNKFIILNKAYRCLTDESIMEKCKTFGNPDGQANYQVAIALPSALLNKKNRAVILALFFLVLLVFMPVVVWIWYTEREKYDSFGVNKDSIRQTAMFMRNENIIVKNVIEMMACSVEMQKIWAIKPGQGNALRSILDNRIQPQMGRERCPYLKSLYLLNNYMLRGKDFPELKDDLNYMHRKIPYLLSSLSDFSLQLTINQIRLFEEMKPLTYNSFMNVLYFSQLYYQGMAEHQNALYQLPGMTDAIVAKSAKKIKGGAQFWEILKTPDMLDKVLGCYDDAQDKERARHYASLLPQIEFTIDVYVDEEGTRADKIYLDDLVTIEFKITDHSIKEGDDAHYMQSQTFPYLKYINWHIFMLGKNPKGLTAIADIKSDKRTVVEKIQTRFPQAGHGSITVLLKPDCYVGFEQDVVASFEINPARTDQTHFIHPEDAEVIKRPTLFNQLAAQLKENNDSDEEEEVDPNDDHNKVHNHGPNCNHDHDEEEVEEVADEIQEQK